MVIRRVISALTSILDPERPVEPLHDWNLSPYIHPLEASDARGGHLVDMKGRDFIDFSSAWGANILGYGYPRVAEAITAQARRFAGVGVPYPEFWELGRLLCEIIPCAEAVRYGKNGSDATMGAVRLARAVTRREHVLHRGYHGFHDWWMAGTPCQGIPESLRGLIHSLPELTPESVEAAFAARPGAIACLILDPMVPPVVTAGAMREIAAIVRREGALLIYDEVVSGFRVAPGGMQQLWGVQPDLACFGKCLANGLPLSVLAGRRRFMDALGSVNYGMTFEGESISIAAAVATLREIVERDVCGALAHKGRRLKEAYMSLAADLEIATCLAGPDARPHLQFEPQGGIPERELRWLFIQELAQAGVLSLGTFNLCYSHDDQDLEATATAFARGMRAVAKAVSRGSVEHLLDDRILRGMRG